MGRRRLDIYTNDIINDYTVCKLSENATAKKWMVSRSVIRRILRENGVHIRGQSEAERLKLSQYTPEQKKAQTRAANAASRGRIATVEEKVKRANTAEKSLTMATDEELRFADMLMRRGIECIPQQAIGFYNCDIGAEPVAVEILGGNWHWYGKRKVKLLNKIRYFIDNGWHILMIVVNEKRGFVLDSAMADYAASYIKSVRSNPPPWCEYRMIRGAHQTIVKGSSKDDEISIIPSFASSQDTRSAD